MPIALVVTVPIPVEGIQVDTDGDVAGIPAVDASAHPEALQAALGALESNDGFWATYQALWFIGQRHKRDNPGHTVAISPWAGVTEETLLDGLEEV